MRETVMPIIYRALGTIQKDSEGRLEKLKSEEELRLSRPRNCLNTLEYEKEFLEI